MKYYRLTSSLLMGLILVITCFFIHPSYGLEDIISSDAYVDYDGDDEGWESEEERISDPFKSYNRPIFKFNNTIATYVLNPLSKAYDLLVPRKAQSSINNLFSNIRMPERFFNNLFQAKFKAAFTEMGRFLINSSLGLGGFFDPARAIFKLEPHDEDFGQTLGYYGMGAGPYIVWPLLGPSSGRDTIGFVVDLAFSPFTWFSILDLEPDEVFTGLRGLRHSNDYSYTVRDSYEGIMEGAIDPYIALQHAYIQNRKKRLESRLKRKRRSSFRKEIF